MRKILHNIRLLRNSILVELREAESIMDARYDACKALENVMPDETISDSDPLVQDWNKQYDEAYELYENAKMRYNELDYLVDSLKEIISHHVSYMFDHGIEGFDWNDLGKPF